MSDGISTAPVAQSRFAALLGSEYAEQLRTELEPQRLLKFGVIFVEFALIVAAIRLLNIESNSFESILTLAFGGFVVNHFLPAAWRHTFFAGLSLVSVLLVFGWQQGAWLLAMGGLLIALCHLPISFRARVALILLAVTVMALERKQLLSFGPTIPGTIWPILGAMFMFRLITYLYDLAHKAAPFSPVRAISYFFMLPNVCFPLFPVVDYKTLQRSIYNDDALRLYQTGVKWMLRGLVHLALYKVVYFLAVVDPAEVENGAGAARYMVSTYLLYLKISGLFHLIIGLLRMFGFGLAETHHFYLFASSFTDFWRRINIYWKDFIQKLVFNPIYFATKRLGATGSLVVATLVAFSATWLFHSYQWFWIRGTFPVVWSDLVFWFGLGLIVMINVLIETRLGRRRSLGKDTRSVRQDAILGLKIASTFTAICVLWTIWSTPEIEDLGFIWRAVLNSGPADIAVLVGIPVGIGVLGVLMGGRQREVSQAGAGSVRTRGGFWREAAMVAFGAGVLILIALQPGLLTPISPRLADVVVDVRARAALNAADMERLRRGYYEDLGDVTRFNSELSFVMGGGEGPHDWAESTQHRARTDAIRVDLVPSSTAVFKGATRTVNSHGMRDREYSVAKEPDTFRVALLGSSHSMGAGVGDGETYENLVEDRLNAELGPVTGLTYEILNFSYGGHTPTQKLETLRIKVLPFEPDVIIFEATTLALNRVFYAGQIRWLAQNDLLGLFPEILNAMERAGVDPEEFENPKTAPTTELMPFAEETLAKLLKKFRVLGEGREAQIALLLLETPDDNSQSLPVLERVKAVGEEVDVSILDLRGAFDTVVDLSTLWVAPFDRHANTAGHALIADRLFEKILESNLVPTKAPVAD